MLDVHLASGEGAQTLPTAAVFVSFFAGCVIIKHSALRSGYLYGAALVLESALLVTAGFLFNRGGVAESTGFLILKYNVLFFPAAFTGCAGVGYIIFTHTSAGSTAPAQR